MSDSKNLQLPYIMAAQAQKHVTHNEAIRALDAIVQLSVLDRDLTTAPANPVDGDRYIVAAPASAAWAGQEQKIAAYQDNAWMFYSPGEGWLAWVCDEDKLLAFDGLVWSEVSGGGAASLNPAPLVGVNTSADAGNRLAVSSANTLLSHEGADHRVKVNKASSIDTASLLYQNNYSGRAEIGLAGDDDLHVKVSGDGSSWNEAIIVNKDSGAVRMPNNALTENLMFNLFQDAGRFSGSPEPAGITASSFVAASYLNPYNGSVFSGHAKFIHNNSTHGGSAGALDPELDALITKLQNTTSTRRFGVEFWVMKIVAGSGTSGPKTVGGITRYLAWTSRSAPLWPNSTWGLNIHVQSGSANVNYTPSAYDLYVDGVEQLSDPVFSDVDGWKQIVWKGNQDPQSYLGYESSLFRLNAEPGSVIYVALPFLIPAQITPGTNWLFGRTSSLEAWR